MALAKGGLGGLLEDFSTALKAIAQRAVAAAALVALTTLATLALLATPATSQAQVSMTISTVNGVAGNSVDHPESDGNTGIMYELTITNLRGSTLLVGSLTEHVPGLGAPGATVWLPPSGTTACNGAYTHGSDGITVTTGVSLHEDATACPSHDIQSGADDDISAFEVPVGAINFGSIADGATNAVVRTITVNSPDSDGLREGDEVFVITYDPPGSQGRISVRINIIDDDATVEVLARAHNQPTESTVITVNEGTSIGVNDYNNGLGFGNLYRVRLVPGPQGSGVTIRPSISDSDVRISDSSLSFPSGAQTEETAYQFVQVYVDYDADGDDETVTITHTVDTTDPIFSSLGVIAETITVNVVDTATAPGAPANFTFTATPRVRSVGLTWDPPTNTGNLPILGYTIDYRIGNSGRRCWVEPDAQGNDATACYDAATNANAIITNTFTTIEATAINIGSTTGSAPNSENGLRQASGNYQARISAHNVAGVGPTALLDFTTLAFTTTYGGALPVRLTAETGAGSMDTYTVVLDVDPGPGPNVTLTPVSSDSGAATVYPAVLEFGGTSGNAWDVAQTITVVAVDDGDGDDEELTISHTVGGVNFPTPTVVTVTVADADVIPETIATPTLTAGGRGETTLMVQWIAPGDGNSPITGYDVQAKLSSAADSTYTETPGSTAAHTGTVTTHSLAGLAENTSYDVRVRAINGVGNGTYSQALTAVTGGSVTIDTPGTIEVCEDGNAGGACTSGSLTYTYTAVLISDPGTTATITSTSANPVVVTVYPAALDFTGGGDGSGTGGNGNWAVAQTFTLTAVADEDVLDHTVAITNEVVNILGLVARDFNVIVRDDDNPAITTNYGVYEADGAFLVQEVSTRTYTVRLRFQPTVETEGVSPAEIIVPLTLSSSKSYLTITPNMLTFTAEEGSWNGLQTVTVDINTTSDDTAVIEHDVDVSGGPSNREETNYDVSQDADADFLAPENVTFNIEQRGVVIEQGGSVVTGSSLESIDEEGSDVYTVHLTAPPSDRGVQVAVGIASDNTDVSVSPESLNFGFDDYETPQTVTVSAIEDDNVDVDTANLAHSPSGGNYTATHDVTVTIGVNPVDRFRFLAGDGAIDDQQYILGREIETLNLPRATLVSPTEANDDITYTLTPAVLGLDFNLNPSGPNEMPNITGRPAEHGTFVMTFTAENDNDDSMTGSFQFTIVVLATGARSIRQASLIATEKHLNLALSHLRLHLEYDAPSADGGSALSLAEDAQNYVRPTSAAPLDNQVAQMLQTLGASNDGDDFDWTALARNMRFNYVFNDAPNGDAPTSGPSLPRTVLWLHGDTADHTSSEYVEDLDRNVDFDGATDVFTIGMDSTLYGKGIFGVGGYDARYGGFVSLAKTHFNISDPGLNEVEDRMLVVAPYVSWHRPFASGWATLGTGRGEQRQRREEEIAHADSELYFVAGGTQRRHQWQRTGLEVAWSVYGYSSLRTTDISDFATASSVSQTRLAGRVTLGGEYGESIGMVGQRMRVKSYLGIAPFVDLGDSFNNDSTALDVLIGARVAGRGWAVHVEAQSRKFLDEQTHEAFLASVDVSPSVLGDDGASAFGDTGGIRGDARLGPSLHLDLGLRSSGGGTSSASSSTSQGTQFFDTNALGLGGVQSGFEVRGGWGLAASNWGVAGTLRPSLTVGGDFSGTHGGSGGNHDLIVNRITTGIAWDSVAATPSNAQLHLALEMHRRRDDNTPDGHSEAVKALLRLRF